MKILVLGSGAREHALCWKIKQSPLASKIYCAPGNGGIAQDATCVPLVTLDDVLEFCGNTKIDLVVIGPEQPLVDGWGDRLRAAGYKVFGPNYRAAQLEGSKGFTKDLCRKYNIPTADYERFTDAESAKRYIRAKGIPIVIKADGLAAGKGVVVAQDFQEALEAVDEMFSGKFGAAGRSVVIEEFMQGEEASFFALCDGERAVEFASAQDHKPVGEGDTGPNTGGMGTYSPAPVVSDAVREQVMSRIIRPTVAAMKAEGMPYQGVLFAGLMITRDGPKLIEFNARFGDPETQVMMMRLEDDLVPLLLVCAEGKLSENTVVKLKNNAAVCVVMAAKGYPGDYRKGTLIQGLDAAAGLDQVKIFHAGTIVKDGQTLSNGGRVLGVTAWADTVASAQKRAYEAVDAIDWPEGFCRRDIAWRAIKRDAA